jgi:hypothetical protein
LGFCVVLLLVGVGSEMKTRNKSEKKSEEAEEEDNGRD